MARIGLVALDTEGKWIGGRYYLQHLVKAVASLPPDERLPLCDVWWQRRSSEDPFAEVRAELAGSVILSPPVTLRGRLRRKLRRVVRGWADARDLFQDADIGVVFPVSPCEHPGVPVVFWLSDFQYLHLPELFGEELCRWYANYFEGSVAKAEIVVVSSEHALNDMRRQFPEAVARTRVLNFCSVPEASWFGVDPARAATQHDLPGKFLILSNQFSHHKNHGTVFEAVRILKEAGHDICVACTGSTFGFRGQDYFLGLQEFVRRHGLEANIRILGMLPREAQIALTRRAIAMLQPSAFEGWSTVVEDGRTLGKIVLASGIDVHREQLGAQHPHYLDTLDPEAWAAAMLVVWDAQAPGPDRAAEAQALAGVEARSAVVGRRFLAVMREVMASPLP